MTLAAWLDPEFWGPTGLGCWMCYDHPPDVVLNHQALCIHCVARWFPGWSMDRVWDWFIGQRERALFPVTREPEGKQLVLEGV